MNLLRLSDQTLAQLKELIGLVRLPAGLNADQAIAFGMNVKSCLAALAKAEKVPEDQKENVK